MFQDTFLCHTITESFEVEVSYAMTTPNFVVENVTFNPAVTEGVTETTATIHMRNISDAKANNVVTTLSGTEIGSTGNKNISVISAICYCIDYVFKQNNIGKNPRNVC